MKIITKNAVYVQKNDLGFLFRTDLVIPAEIFIKAFNNEVTVIDNNNRFDFVKFEKESEIEYFKSLDWIIDYDQVKDLDEKQIIDLGQRVAQEKNNIARIFNAKSEEERRANMHMVDECDRLNFKIYSLRDVLWFKQGNLPMTLPEGVESPASLKTTEEKGLKRLLKKLKKRSNKQ